MSKNVYIPSSCNLQHLDGLFCPSNLGKMLSEEIIEYLKRIINLSNRFGLLPCKWPRSENSLIFTGTRLQRFHLVFFLMLGLLYEAFLVFRWVQAETDVTVSQGNRIQCRYYVFGNMIYTVRVWTMVVNYDRHHLFLNRAWQYFQGVKGKLPPWIATF